MVGIVADHIIEVKMISSQQQNLEAQIKTLNQEITLEDLGIYNLLEKVKAKIGTSSIRDTKIITLCGSVKFLNYCNIINTALSKLQYAVFPCLFPGWEVHDQNKITELDRKQLDSVHKKKIQLSHAIVVINPGGYISESSRYEIVYAESLGKYVVYYEEPDLSISPNELINSASLRLFNELVNDLGEKTPVPTFDPYLDCLSIVADLKKVAIVGTNSRTKVNFNTKHFTSVVGNIYDFLAKNYVLRSSVNVTLLELPPLNVTTTGKYFNQKSIYSDCTKIATYLINLTDEIEIGLGSYEAEYTAKLIETLRIIAAKCHNTFGTEPEYFFKSAV